MGLQEILDIQETQTVDETGEVVTVFEVSFTTEETSGSFTVDVPEESFTPEVALERARERAEEVDATFGGEGSPDEE